MSISLCMIVKDEERNLPKCLESVKDLVDEIIIVDTGSKDKTIEIAKSYGAKVYYFDWCDDFSRARNVSIQYATKDWIFIMDADEYIDEENKNKIKKLLLNPSHSAYYIKTKNLFSQTTPLFSVHALVRLYKNIKGIHYTGKVHNQIEPSLIKLGIIPRDTDIFIYHTGYLLSPEEARKKHQRSIEILKEWCQKEPNNPLPLFYLAGKYQMIGEDNLMIKCLYKVMTLPAPKVIHLFSCATIIDWLNKKKKCDEALFICEGAFKEYPDAPIFHVCASESYRIKGDYLNAIKELKRAIYLYKLGTHVSSLYIDIDISVLYTLIGENYELLKNTSMAKFYYKKAIEVNPQYSVPQIKIASMDND